MTETLLPRDVPRHMRPRDVLRHALPAAGQMHADCVACKCPPSLRWLLMRQEQSAGLFFDTLGHDKFEASSITHYKGRYVMVFDNLDEIGFVVRPASWSVIHD